MPNWYHFITSHNRAHQPLTWPVHMPILITYQYACPLLPVFDDKQLIPPSSDGLHDINTLPATEMAWPARLELST
eukprot:CAMPEP_0202902964 /NCGR_PEP_ID=MMETSP1392-20130828/19737_1 /ASSEMBLY_ACC=CAM_ASM_000868 /TAXON_ID=225041 /ORGANISM="Chlamydomonas chlamydogama, Strain SAG 11-48b" /LENGTH=74 /DNA_ID=CAMNT_0049589869 /DNA_START=178 /DNA_END=402 /DNA_ORIENTATION=+